MLKQRDELLDHCLNLLGEVPETHVKCKLLGMHACTRCAATKHFQYYRYVTEQCVLLRLVLLEPPLPLAATARLLDTSILFLTLEGDSIKELLSAVATT